MNIAPKSAETRRCLVEIALEPAKSPKTTDSGPNADAQKSSSKAPNQISIPGKLSPRRSEAQIRLHWKLPTRPFRQCWVVSIPVPPDGPRAPTRIVLDDDLSEPSNI